MVALIYLFYIDSDLFAFVIGCLAPTVDAYNFHFARHNLDFRRIFSYSIPLATKSAQEINS